MTKTPRRGGTLAMLTLATTLALPAVRAEAAQAGDVLQNVALRDAKDAPAQLPDLGAKVLAIFYNDADEADLNDPLADAIKARKFDETRYRGVGIANLADSKMPNFLIRKVIRGKIEKYKSTILTDPDRLLARAWGLGDCNNTSVFILIGKDGVVQHVRRGAIRGDDIPKIVEMIAKQVEAAAAPAPPPAQ